MEQRVEILGLAVFSACPEVAVRVIAERIETKKPTKVAFLNAHLSLLAARNSALRQELQEFDLFNDGVGVEIANRLLNSKQFVANLNGTDFIPYLLSNIDRDLRLFLLGGRPDTLEKAANAIRLLWDRHTIVGQADGYFDDADENSIGSTVAACRPDLVLVAMGNAKQEHWIANNVPRCCLCAIGVGAWFDFVGGVVPRAPRCMRAMRIEWLYRLWREPKRLWRRYVIGNAAFLLLVARVALTARVLQRGARGAILGRGAAPSFDHSGVHSRDK